LEEKQADTKKEYRTDLISEQSVNKDIARLDVMNEEYTAMADKLRDEFNSTLSSSVKRTIDGLFYRR